MKLIVETKGNHQLLNPLTGTLVRWNRPTVVVADSFITNQIALGQLTLSTAEQLPDTASDAEFELWLKECDGKADLAVASYVAKFFPVEISEVEVEVEVVEDVAKKPPRNGR